MRRYLFNRIAVVLSLGLLAFSLSACGSSEESERKAFIEFLQTRINKHSGVRVPKLTEADKEKFGPYAADYQLIIQYNDDAGEIMKPVMESASSLSGMRSPSDVLNKRALITAVRTKLQEQNKKYVERKAKLEADHAALKHPEDLKVVFEAAYNHVITEPGSLMTRTFSNLDKLLATYEDFGAVLEKNKDKIKMSGLSFEAEDQQVIDEINSKVAEVQKASNEVMKLQGEYLKMIR